jgi:molybdopterin converting factor small subunit
MAKGAKVWVRLFGLGKGAASQLHLTRLVGPGATVTALWEGLRTEAQPGDRLASIPREGLLALLNGRPLRTLAEWDAAIGEGDTVVFMPKAFGG